MPIAPAHRPAIPAALARSCFLLSAERLGTPVADTALTADLVILDLEDSVAPTAKAAAREDAAEWMRGGHRCWVRVNVTTGPFWRNDIERLRSVPELAGVMVPKAESVDALEEVFRLLGGDIPLIALVESAVGIEAAPELARAKGVARLAFGSGDYRRDTGTSDDDLAMSYPRSRLVTASRVGDLPGPIDGPTLGLEPQESSLRARTSARLGMTGKLCLAPDDVAVANAAFSPSADEVDWAEAFLSAFEARGSVARDGSDLPRLATARKIQRLASVFGGSGGR